MLSYDYIENSLFIFVYKFNSNLYILWIRSVVGYIEKIFKRETHTHKEKNTDFQILKFILNNNDGMQIQCNIYNDNIERFNLKIHEVIIFK